MKVADFGLAESFYGSKTYAVHSEKKFPLERSAVEVLTKRQFSKANDVWAMGVVLWEIFSLGDRPWGHLAEVALIPKLVKKGERLERFDRCPEALYKLMRWSWQARRLDRPAISQMKMAFTKIMEEVIENESNVRRSRKQSLNPAVFSELSGSTSGSLKKNRHSL